MMHHTLRPGRGLHPFIAVLWTLAALGGLVLSPPALAQDAEPPADAPAATVPVPDGAPVVDDAPASENAPTLADRFNDTLAEINTQAAKVVYFDVSFGVMVDEQGEGTRIPIVVAILGAGAVFFTFWHGFINLRGFPHAIAIIRGKYSRHDDPGDVTPFKALTSALSATVGLGNIASVAVAMNKGGPGALFWMMFLGFFGMSSKFHESTLGQLYRQVNPDGTISGGPMYYLDRGLAAKGPAFAVLGKVLAVTFCVFCICGALGGGNMFQANQAFEGFYNQFVATETVVDEARAELPEAELRQMLTDPQLALIRRGSLAYQGMSLEQVRAALPGDKVRQWVKNGTIEATLDPEVVRADRAAANERERVFAIGFGILLSTLVAMVIIGGITRIGATTAAIVPTMCLLYVGGCLTVLLINLQEIPGHVLLVLQEAFQWDSFYGGLIGVMIIGFTRAAFSSEAGLGSSAIAHSAAKTAEPVREGLVASLEPFVDTIIICFMTAMVVLVTDAYNAPQFVGEDRGSAITLLAFERTGPLASWFPAVLSISVVLFAFSTMISWGYYGERAYGYLFGLKTVIVFRLVFVLFVFIGTVASLDQVIDFSDMTLLSMAFPNIIGGVLLAPLVRRKAREYWRRHRSGNLPHEE